jgi:LPXTG-motif cell wall-anchored protein
MSTYIGVRTHASEVHAAHKSRIAATNAARLAAAGLALMLSVGFSGGAHAAEGEPKKQSDPNDAAVQAAEMVRVCHLKDGRYITVAPEAADRGHSEGHYDPTGEACAAESGTEESDTDEQTDDEQTDEQTDGEQNGGEQSGDEESGAEESVTESAAEDSGTEEDQPIVLTPLPDQDTRIDVQPTKPTKPTQAGGSGDNRGEVLGVEIESSGTAKDRATPRGKTDKDTDSKPGFRDEILPAATGTANRPAALVLPQTGAAANMALQAGAGLALLLGGLFTLAGRRRQDDC